MEIRIRGIKKMKIFIIMFLTLTLANSLLRMQKAYRLKMAEAAGSGIQFLDACFYLWILKSL